MVLIIVFGALLIIFSSFYLPYIFLKPYIKPYLKDRKGRIFILKCYFTFCLVCFALAMFGKYLMRGPDYFEQGIEQLHANEYVLKKINGFSSYSYRKYSLPKAPIKHAIFKVELTGDSLSLYLTCTMEKIQNDWKLTKIKQDSISINK